MNSKVSILIPLYNSEAYIAETISSALAQKWTDKEIIIVDDGSTDKSYEIAKSFESSAVKVYRNPGKGACSARNYAFEKCIGDYIQYLDADDLLSNNKLSDQMAVINGQSDVVAVCNTWRFDNSLDSAVAFDENFLCNIQSPSELFIRLWGGYGDTGMIQTSAWLTPRNLITEGWNENLKKDQDGEFFARIALNAQEIIYTPNARNYYRINMSTTCISHQKSREHIESNMIATKSKMSFLLQHTQSSDALRAVSTQFRHVAIEAWPQFRDIYSEAMALSNKYGPNSYNPVLGGRIIELLKRLFGWKLAKYVSHYLHNPSQFIKHN